MGAVDCTDACTAGNYPGLKIPIARLVIDGIEGDIISGMIGRMIYLDGDTGAAVEVFDQPFSATVAPVGPPPSVQLSEIRINQPGVDTDEYFEIAGPPGQSLDGLTYIVIGDFAGSGGIIEAIVDLTGHTIPASGFFVTAERSFTMGAAEARVRVSLFIHALPSWLELVSVGFGAVHTRDGNGSVSFLGAWAPSPTVFLEVRQRLGVAGLARLGMAGRARRSVSSTSARVLTTCARERGESSSRMMPPR